GRAEQDVAGPEPLAVVEQRAGEDDGRLDRAVIVPGNGQPGAKAQEVGGLGVGPQRQNDAARARRDVTPARGHLSQTTGQGRWWIEREQIVLPARRTGARARGDAPV